MMPSLTHWICGAQPVLNSFKNPTPRSALRWLLLPTASRFLGAASAFALLAALFHACLHIPCALKITVQIPKDSRSWNPD
jgi:hypothetical protein